MSVVEQARGVMLRLRSLWSHEKGETLLGTMIGVLMISVVTASFAGVFIASMATTARAKATTERLTVLNTLNNEALADLRVETGITPAGWTAGTPVSGFTTSIQSTPSTLKGATANQWGKRNTNNTVTVYTAVPRPNSTSSCAPTLPAVQLNAGCLVTMITGKAVASTEPTPVTSSQWRNYVSASTWSNTALEGNTGVTFAAAGAVGTATLNAAAPTQAAAVVRPVKYVMKVTTTAAANITFTWTGGTKVQAVTAGTNYFYGTFNLPGDQRSFTVTTSAPLKISNAVTYVNK